MACAQEVGERAEYAFLLWRNLFYYLRDNTSCDVVAEIFVIATTNQPDLIDSAVLRRGRIDLKVYLSPPDLAVRKAMLRKHMEGRPYEFGIDYDSLAALAEGYVASDIAFAVNEAARQAAREDRKISYLDLETIIKSNRSSLSSLALEKFEQIRKRLEGENR